MTSPIDDLYWEYHVPLGMKELVEQLVADQPNRRNAPLQLSGSALNREWFSQPRPCQDNTTEVVTVQFKLPVVLSEISFETLRVPVRIELWYQDRLGNWRPVLDPQRVPAALTLSASNSATWYRYHSLISPIIAKAFRWHLTRVVDPQLGAKPFVVGLKNGLPRRNLYERGQGLLPFEDEQDTMGNVITKSIKDWEAVKAIDDAPATFWRSAPLPDPEAVCSLYLDTRAPDGSPQLIDRIFLDPLYNGQSLNIYYSNDDTINNRRLSPISLLPDTDENTDWKPGRGRRDTSTVPGVGTYRFPMKLGPQISQAAWVGIEWTPDFDPLSGPPQNPVLFEVVPSEPDPDQWWPVVFYDVGSGEIALELSNGTFTQTYRALIDPAFVTGDPLRIVAGWSYGPDHVTIQVYNKLGHEVALLEEDDELPPLITLDGQMGFSNFRGIFTAHVLKLEQIDFTNGRERFLANPMVYVNPDPVIPDADGNIPSTTLDNAVYAVDWTLQQHGCGGGHESIYTDKIWTPVWRDYLTQKGKLRLPTPTLMKYIKLEFSDLTEEPYPVYDYGIQVRYKTFPVKIQKNVPAPKPDHHHHGGLLSGLIHAGMEVLSGAIGVVNWLQAGSVSNAVRSVFGPVNTPVDLTLGSGTQTGSIPAESTQAIIDQQRSEVNSPYVYRRLTQDNTTLANQYVNVLSAPNQTLTSSLGMQEDTVSGAFAGVQEDITNPGSPPRQGSDFWVFPGGLLRMPAYILSVLTGLTQVRTARRNPPSNNRPRFDGTIVHRYETKVLVRDAAVAYFTGVREVSALSTTYIANEDPVVFDFPVYDSTQWVMTNTNQLDTGPVSTAGMVYDVPNPDFDLGVGGALSATLGDWGQISGTWSWDGSDFNGYWYPGAAKATATGVTTEMWSAFVTSQTPEAADVFEGDNITFSVAVKWEDLVVTNGQAGIQLGLVTYFEGEVVDDTIVIDDVTYANWATHTDNTYVVLSGDWEVPENVDQVRVRVVVTDDASSGSVWFDRLLIYSADDVEATLFKEFQTTSTFAKVRCDFRDSGTVRSNAMWARADPLATNIDYTTLAYYTSTVPDVLPGGTWGDTFARWGSEDVAWGAPRALVAIDVAPDRIFDGQRVLHFRRDAGAGECGVKVRQWTNFYPNALFRIHARWLKPYDNDNTITVRLRRVSDGVYIHEETINNPEVGYWHEFATHFVEVPDSQDQVYHVELSTTGDDEDELYLSDLWVELAHVRYFMRLGGLGAHLFDVTELRYADSAIVSTTTPVNEFSLETVILTPKAYVYGAKAQPLYLK